MAHVGKPAYPDPGDRFEKAIPDVSTLTDPLIVRKGVSPRTDESVSLAGSSLKEEQHRRLHVRGVCTLRPDGIKEIEQHLYNPLGSIFHFLSEEAPGNGGQGRAPDANTYISAGIGFCFMTQIGRFAGIMRKHLAEYRIAQDTHFSLGGASGHTGKAGTADPVETHVYLRTEEDEDFARTIVDMSEQTCFLHALCRTQLNPKIRISSFKAV